MIGEFLRELSGLIVGGILISMPIFAAAYYIARHFQRKDSLKND